MRLRVSNMQVKFGNGKTEQGPGVEILLDGNELATAIEAYLVSHGVHVRGPRTITVNGELCESGRIYVDPSGLAMVNGERWNGTGTRDA